MTSQNTKNTLFVSDLPIETTFGDLALFFSSYNFQYATLNYSKTSTWAQVYFDNEDSATKAKNELNGDILIPKASISHQGRPIRICYYEKRGTTAEKNIKQSLLVKNLDKKMAQKEFYQLFLQYGDIESAKIDYDDQGISKGFGYIYYSSSESAEKAKMELHNKLFYDKKINIVNLLPVKSKDFTNTLFVKNIPNGFQENDLKKLFEKYGDIKHVSIARYDNYLSKGYGFVSFTNFEMTIRCFNQCNKNEISFPGLAPLCVKLAARKEVRVNKTNMLFNSSDLVKIQFNLEYSTDAIENAFDLEKEIRLFIKVIMLQEYNPKEVDVDFDSYSGVVTFHSKKDYDLYVKMYNEFCQCHCPSFYCIPHSFLKNESQIPTTSTHNQIMGNNVNGKSNHYQNNLISFDTHIPQLKQLHQQYPQSNDNSNCNVNYFDNGFCEENIPIWSQHTPIINNAMSKPIGHPFDSRMMKMIPQFIPSQIPFISQEETYNHQNLYIPEIDYRMNSQHLYHLNQHKYNNKYVDLRNLQELNADQLQSQFNKPVQHYFNPDMFNHDNDEEISNEIADTIYEIAFNKYPK